MIFHVPTQNIVAGRYDRPKCVCKTSQDKFALPLKKKKIKGKAAVLVWPNPGSNIVILPLCQVPHLSLVTRYTCAFPPTSLPSPQPLHCLIPYWKQVPVAALLRALFVPSLLFLFNSFCYFEDLLSSTCQPSSTPFLSLFFSLFHWFVS